MICFVFKAYGKYMAVQLNNFVVWSEFLIHCKSRQFGVYPVENVGRYILCMILNRVIICFLLFDESVFVTYTKIWFN